jgi:hypothetical protein
MKNLYFIKTSWRGFLIVASNREIAQEKLFDNMSFGESISSVEFICVAGGDFMEGQVLKIISDE